MDPGHFVHSQAQNYQQSQHQPQQQPLESSQIPDESYIEKLFPKCPPKPSNHMRRNKRMARFNEGQQQQQKRLSRNRNQPPPRAVRERPQELTHNGTVASGSNNTNFGRETTNNHASFKLQKRYNYSDSSDNETQTNGKVGSTSNGDIKRSGSSQFGSDATNKVENSLMRLNDKDSAGPKLSTAYSKPRSKKYQASKSLLQQLSRSQSSNSKLGANSQPLHGVKSETNIEQRPLVRNEPKDRVGDMPSSSADDMNGRKPDRGKRTRRGIVFAEPLPGRVEHLEISNTVEKRNVDCHLATPKSDVLENTCTSVDSLVLVQNRKQIRLPEQLPQVHTKQARMFERETADFELLQDGPDKDADQAIVATPAGVDSYPALEEVNNQKSVAIASPKSIELEDSAELDQGDEDKFINLFVYDQTVVPNQKLDDNHLEPPSILRNDVHNDNDLDTSTDKTSSEEKHRLLASDFDDNEQGVITNDASTEELCSLDDNDTGVSLKQRLTKPKRHLEDEIGHNLQQEKPDQDNSTNKSNLKHHRSMGTLQTVDEKAEINIEDDILEKKNNIEKTELIDISEANTMLPSRDHSNVVRRAFVPPGFPQRIRPTPRVPLALEVSSQLVVPCPEPSPVDPRTQSTNLINEAEEKSCSTDKGWPSQEDKESANEVLGNSPSERAIEFVIASESQSVVEKNLSEALSKVTLNQTIADNLESAPPSTNLRHHKLPNESSHFSVVRSPIIRAKESTEPVGHRSSVQFEALSDNESGHDEIVDSNPCVSRASASTSASRGQLKRQDTPAISSLRASVSARVHEDLASTAKTALVFPRLDEGLSSEAESNDEGAEEEDDRAMEADVDADDDDDDDEDEEDVDEDTESPTRANRQVSLQTGTDPFFCHQQMLKPQNRSVGSSQQISSSLQSQDLDLQHMKQPQTSSYANFNLNDDQATRLESMKPNHADQNGVHSNYWMSGVTNQQATMSSQPSPSASQFTIQRNQFGNSNSNNNNNGNSTSSNNNLSRSNSYGNREDAKTATRVSSDTDNETDRLLGTQRNDQLQKSTVNEVASSAQAAESQSATSFPGKQGTNSREVQIEGVLFNVKYLGSTHTECEGRGEKEDRIQQAEMAVHEVKFRNGELQTAVEAQLFISTEKIMVLDDKKRVIMMDHSLRTISYIADIGDAVVLIVRKKGSSLDAACDNGRPMSKTSCHVFESNESHTITKSISQAFHVAYTELLKANGGGDPNSYIPKELDYQEVLNSQEMPMTELDMFASKNNQREVIVPKQVGEILGLSIVESGWGSVLPTAVIASLKQDGPAYRCKKLSVGDQILSINGESLVGLSLAECQQKLRKTKAQSVARLWVVPCPITVEVKIKRPDTKYQLGFSVQHGVICSLLRGGIAERGGVRVGHRIISINGTTVVGVPHDKIVTLLASSVGEIRMKTCLTSLYRHMLGEEKKHQWV